MNLRHIGIETSKREFNLEDLRTSTELKGHKGDNNYDFDDWIQKGGLTYVHECAHARNLRINGGLKEFLHGFSLTLLVC